MSSYNSIYASLAQISVVGQMNAELAKHESGKLDIFTSAFYVHNTFACGFIRHEDQAEIKNKAVATFQPPRSFDILHSVVVTAELPGMIQWDGAAEDTTKLTNGTIGYKENVGQVLIDNIALEIGGSVMDTIHGEWLHIHEELHGQPGRRLQNAGLAEVTDPKRKSRIYVPLTFWFQGGSLSRALKLVSMQLHRVEFKVTYNAFTDLLVGNTAAGGDYDDVYVRNSEEVDVATLNRLTGAVRAADGNDFATDPTANGLLTAARGAFTMDFHGIFLNSETRAEYLNLQETSLLVTTQRTRLGASTSPTQVPLDFKNAVYELVVAVSEQAAGNGTWGLAPDAEALKSLSFSISSTPRTLPDLEPQFYRKVTQFLGPNTTSTEEKGIYYYNFSLKDSLNGTNVVSSYLNASKVDDLRIRYSTQSANAAVTVYARAYNLLNIKGGFAGRLFQ